jgi:flavin-dependent dehydrogenase
MLEVVFMQDLPAFKDRYDVVIVGACCAGAATAMLLARSGAQDLLVDRQK